MHWLISYLSLLVGALVAGCASTPPTSYIDIPIAKPSGQMQSRSQVAAGDPIYIEISKSYIQDANQSWWDFSSPNIAVLVQVNTSPPSSYNGKWLLADIYEHYSVPSPSNDDSIVIWSGFGPSSGTIRAQLVVLNEEQKSEYKSKLNFAKGLAGILGDAVPLAGTALQVLLDAGTAIIDNKENYTQLLEYRSGASPDKPIVYGAHVLIGNEEKHEQQKYDLGNLWYDQPRFMLMHGDKVVHDNWVVFRVIKGFSDAFSEGEAGSLEDIRKTADNWISANSAAAPFQSLNGSVNRLISSAESARLLGKTVWKSKASVVRALQTMKSHRQSGAGIQVNDQDYNMFMESVAAYLPNDCGSDFQNIDEWIKAADKIDGQYEWNDSEKKWVRKGVFDEKMSCDKLMSNAADLSQRETNAGSEDSPAPSQQPPLPKPPTPPPPPPTPTAQPG